MEAARPVPSDERGGKDMFVPPILSVAGAAASNAFILRLNVSVEMPNSPPDCFMAARPTLFRAPTSSVGSYVERSLNRLLRSARLRFPRGGSGGGGPLGLGVDKALGLTDVVRLCVLVDLPDTIDEGRTVNLDVRD